MKIIVRVGGSVVGSPLNSVLISKYVSLLKTLKQEGHDVVAVVGGGSLARDFIKVVSDLGLDESMQDWAAIHVSRLFAQLFVLGLDDPDYGDIATSIVEMENYLKYGKIVIMGGLYPGMTTDSVAALIGEHITADLLVKGSNVDGIYTKDPKKFSDSKKLNTIKFEDLSGLFKAKNHRAGINQIIDPKAVRIIQRCRLKTVVVDGYDPDNIIAAVKGDRVGTIIE
ncbi:UMP kinase [Candidatus Bathyarchaeota archaeon]|nr:UMP kinase [Candidatus Bathyarchaeota archaeon]